MDNPPWMQMNEDETQKYHNWYKKQRPEKLNSFNATPILRFAVPIQCEIAKEEIKMGRIIDGMSEGKLPVDIVKLIWNFFHNAIYLKNGETRIVESACDDGDLHFSHIYLAKNSVLRIVHKTACIRCRYTVNIRCGIIIMNKSSIMETCRSTNFITTNICCDRLINCGRIEKNSHGISFCDSIEHCKSIAKWSSYGPKLYGYCEYCDVQHRY